MPEIRAVVLIGTAEPAAFAHGVAGNTGGTDMRLANARSCHIYVRKRCA
jgi:hypothetical protein